MAKSIFDPSSGDENLRGGMSGYLGAQGKAYSKMPEDLIDGKVEEDPEEVELEKKAETDPTQAVEQIKEALDERRHDEPAATSAVDASNKVD